MSTVPSTETSGRGAWTSKGGTLNSKGTAPGPYYVLAKGQPLVGSEPSKSFHHFLVNLGVKALQKQLTMRGFKAPDGYVLSGTGTFAGKTDEVVKVAQQSFGMLSPKYTQGLVGTTFAFRLWRPTVETQQVKFNIPNNYLRGLFYHESSYDPAAQGSATWYDLGFGQINTQVHQVPVELALNPLPEGTWQGSIAWTAGYLRDKYLAFKAQYPTRTEDELWTYTIASYNAPSWAAQWAKTGSPPNATISAYVNNVKAKALLTP